MNSQGKLLAVLTVVLGCLWAAPAQPFAPFDQCNFTTVEPALKAQYKKMHILVTRTTMDTETIHGETAALQETYEVVQGPSTFVVNNSSTSHTYNEPTLPGAASGLAQSLAGDLGFNCGAAAGESFDSCDSAQLAEMINASSGGMSSSVLAQTYGLYFFDTWAYCDGGFNQANLNVTASTSGSSYTATITMSYSGNTHSGSITLTFEQDFDGAFVPGKEVNDGQDNGGPTDCEHGGNLVTQNNANLPTEFGMPRWHISEPYLNMWIKDTPVFYTTSLGKRIDFTVNYKQRDMRPGDTTVPITGWNHNWNSYISFAVPTYCYGLNSSASGSSSTPYARNYLVPNNYLMTNDFSQWNAILYSPDNSESYFNFNSLTEARTGLTLMPADGQATHIYYNSPQNPAGGPNVARSVGFRLVHPDGSQDIYGQVSSLRPIWGPSVSRGHPVMSATAPADMDATYTSSWAAIQTPAQQLDANTPDPTVVGYLAGEALLTDRIDPYGNTIHLVYDNANRLITIIDYDQKSTHLTYDNNGLLAQVAMPYGKSALFTYKNGVLASITDAANMTSSFGYTPFTYVTQYIYIPPVSPNPGHYEPVSVTENYCTSITNLYGTNVFAYTQSPFFTSITNPGTSAVLNLYVGQMGGLNVVDRSCTITYPDQGQELYAYRYDSTGLMPSNYPAAQLPDDPLGTLDNGGSADNTGSVPRDSRLTTRNSLHWNRQQTSLIAGMDLTQMTSNQVSQAAVSHWLADPSNPNLLAEVISLKRLPSPDGTTQGALTWFDYKDKPLISVYNGTRSCWQASPDYSDRYFIQLNPDGNTYYQRTEYDYGLPATVTETYTSAAGSILERSYGYTYEQAQATETCSSDGSTVSWTCLLLARITLPDGTWYNFSDPNDVTTTTTIGGITFTTTLPLRQNLTITDPLNNPTTYYYNNRAQLAGIKHANGLTTTNLFRPNGFLSQSIDLEAQKTNSYSFANGLVYTSTNALGLYLTYTWDNLDRLTSVTYPDGTTTTTTYQKLDAVARTDRLGHSSYWHYNAMDQLDKYTDANNNSTYYHWCFCGGLDGITNAQLHWTSFTRDNDGNVVYTYTDDGFSTTYSRDIYGKITSFSDDAKHSLNYTYNVQGLVTSVANPAGTVYSVVYDSADRPVSVTDAQGNTVTYQFDDLDRVLARSNANGVTDQNSYGPAGITQHLDALNKLTSFVYDLAGRLASITDANSTATQFGYDALGDLVSLTDGRNNSKHWRYDMYGRQIAETNANNVLVRTNGYNANGWLAAQWTAARGLTQFGYDYNGNLASISYPNNGSVIYSYNALNQLATMSDRVGNSTFGYTGFGAFRSGLASETGPWANSTVTYDYQNHLLSTVYLGTWHESINYDAAVRPQVFTSLLAGGFTYAFNGAGRQVASLTMPYNTATYGYDSLGELNSIQFQNNSPVTTLDFHSYTNDPRGLITTGTRMNGVNLAYGYDNIGQLTRAQAFESSGTSRLNENFTYGYDASHNLASRVNNTLTQTFTSDPADQLQSVVRSGTLTVVGNVTGAVASVAVNGKQGVIYGDQTYATTSGLTLRNGNNMFVTVSTNTSGTLVQSTMMSVRLPVSTGATYDLNGNLLGDGLRSFNYDDANQLTNVTVSSQWKSDFVYDGLGRRRIARDYSWSNGGWTKTNETRYIYDGMTVLQEQDANNAALVTYTRGLDLSGTRQGAGGIGGLLARTDSSGTTFYHSDAGGNVTSMTDSSGNVVARYLYDPFGNLLGKWGPMADVNRYRFSSKEVHPNSGLYYYGFRFYDPNMQRWLNPDPIRERGQINLYGYVANNPMRGIDPLGLYNPITGPAGPVGSGSGLADPSVYFPSIPSAPASTSGEGFSLFEAATDTLGGYTLAGTGLEYGSGTARLGSNWKLYTTPPGGAHPFYGNKFVLTCKIEELAHSAGALGFGAGLFLDSWGVYTGQESWGKAEVNTGVGALGLYGGPVGASAAAAYIAADLFYPGGALGASLNYFSYTGNTLFDLYSGNDP